VNELREATFMGQEKVIRGKVYVLVGVGVRVDPDTGDKVTKRSLLQKDRKIVKHKDGNLWLSWIQKTKNVGEVN
jgi:hypothetical protein